MEPTGRVTVSVKFSALMCRTALSHHNIPLLVLTHIDEALQVLTDKELYDRMFRIAFIERDFHRYDCRSE